MQPSSPTIHQAPSNPILQKFLHRIRDPSTGKGQFRQSIERIGQIMGLQIAGHLQTAEKKIKTVLDQQATHQVLKEEPVLITILRAGIPFHAGMQRIFMEAESGFFGAKRNQETLKPQLSYVAIPDVKGKVVIVADTMLATGGTFIEVIKEIKKFEPARVIVGAVIASEYGVNAIRQFDSKIDIFYACIDPKLNQKGYIVPGLGDAGDRSFGTKL